MLIYFTRHFHERLFARFGLVLDEAQQLEIVKKMATSLKDEPPAPAERGDNSCQFDIVVGKTKFVAVLSLVNNKVVTCYNPRRMGNHKAKKIFRGDNKVGIYDPKDLVRKKKPKYRKELEKIGKI